MMHSRFSNSYSEQSEIEEKDHQSQVSSSEIYTNYEDLKNPFQDEKSLESVFLELKSHAHDKNDWKIQFDVLENLRIMNKFYPNETGTVLDNFTSFIQKGMNSIRTNISKNSLLLVREIYSNINETKPTFEFLKHTIPVCLEKAISDKVFIKNEARLALKVLEKQGFNDQVVCILCEKSFDKNSNISELAFATICQMSSDGKENLTKCLSLQGLQVLFESISKAINGKRAAMKRGAENICLQIKANFTESQITFEHFLSETLKLKDSDISTIIQCFSEKKSKPNSGDFANFLKQQKGTNTVKQENKFDMALEDNNN